MEMNHNIDTSANGKQLFYDTNRFEIIFLGMNTLHTCMIKCTNIMTSAKLQFRMSYVLTKMSYKYGLCVGIERGEVSLYSLIWDYFGILRQLQI